jgi:hypothetical protein
MDSLFTVGGATGPGYSGDSGLILNATFKAPIGICQDTIGNFYILEEQNNVVRKVAHNTGIITTICGTGAAGYFGDGGPATSAKMENPSGICVDRAGNVYIADYSNNRVRKVDVATHQINTFVGNGTPGYMGDNGPASGATVSFPSAVCTDSADNLYIADYGNNCIRFVNTSTGTITTVAGNGMGGYTGDGNLAVNALLRNPIALHMSSWGILYISDKGNNVVRAIYPNGRMYTVAGNGNHGYTGDNGPALQATFSILAGVFGDADTLYIADEGNSAIRRVVSPTTAIHEPSMIDGINLYPNPCPGQLNYEIIEPKRTSIEIYNIYGQLVRKVIIEEKKGIIDIADQLSGIYFVKLLSLHESKIFRIQLNK